VRNRFPLPTYPKDLEDILQKGWYKTPLQTVQDLYELIPISTEVLLKINLVKEDKRIKLSL
jgi:hypothetical protein